jgi:hypothetical protein
VRSEHDQVSWRTDSAGHVDELDIRANGHCWCDITCRTSDVQFARTSSGPEIAISGCAWMRGLNFTQQLHAHMFGHVNTGDHEIL